MTHLDAQRPVGCYATSCDRVGTWECRQCFRWACKHHCGYKNDRTREATCVSCSVQNRNRPS